MKKYILFYLLFCLSVGGWAKDFVHPGILHSSEALRRIAGLVKMMLILRWVLLIN